MNRKQRAEKVQSHLDKLYPSPSIPLNHSNHFTLLIAVLLSAQSTDKKVNELTPDLFRLASCPGTMKLLGQEKIYSIIKPLGLSRQKAKHIYLLSSLLIDNFSGQVPNDFNSLEMLPGVGHKTASVVMAQAFGIPTFPVDTHIHRLAQRWGLTNGMNVKQTEKDLKSLFPTNSWNKLHLQIIFYGREFCTARGCDGTKCHLCKALFPKRIKAFIAKKA